MLRFAVITAAVLALDAGCADLQQAEVAQPPAGLLTDPARFHAGPADGPIFVYVAPDGDLSRYRRVMLDPVTVWRGPHARGAGPSQANAQILADALYTILYEELSADYQIVSEPGEETLRLQAGLGRLDDPAAGLAVVSTVIPQMRLVSQLRALPTDGTGLAAASTFEVRVLDSLSGDLLEASVDRWPAARAAEDGASAEEALLDWSRLVRQRLCLARGGETCAAGEA